MVIDNTLFNGSGDRDQNVRRIHHDEILIDDEWEVIYWCLVLKCTKENLIETVRKFGNSSSVVRGLLGNGHRDN